MPTKIRLQRHGKKSNAYFHVIVVDSRKKRNGSYIERIGSYNPNSNPATIQLDFDRALYWVKNGADMSDTMRAMLSYRGVLYRNHLERGIAKGVLTQEQADAKFTKWMESKTGAIETKRSKVNQAKAEALKKQMEAESAVKESKAQKIQAKRVEAAKAAEEAAAAKAADEAAKAAEEAAKTTPAAQAETTETTPEAASEATPEASAETPKE